MADDHHIADPTHLPKRVRTQLRAWYGLDLHRGTNYTVEGTHGCKTSAPTGGSSVPVTHCTADGGGAYLRIDTGRCVMYVQITAKDGRVYWVRYRYDEQLPEYIYLYGPQDVFMGTVSNNHNGFNWLTLHQSLRHTTMTTEQYTITAAATWMLNNYLDEFAAVTP